jgi:predicted MPP superfamily phosphohydrolase
MVKNMARSPLKYTRRQFVRTAVAALVVAPPLAGLYAWQVEPRWIETVHLPLPIVNLPPDLVGRTLVQFSDLHIGERFDWRMFQPALESIRAAAPDIVVYTGDFITYDDATEFDHLQDFLSIAPQGTLGSAAILGNHDYGRGWSQPDVAQRVTDLVEGAGIPVLRNDVLDVAGLTIAGVDDYWGTNYDPATMLATLAPDQPTLVLCHNPDAADDPVWSDYRGWILAGHTHGGQVRPPFLPPPVIPVRNRRYTAGQIPLEDGRTLYINRGLGHLYPVRFNVRPEVTIFTLENKGV